MAANEREAAGDADAAIRVIADHPTDPSSEPLWSPWRVDRLGQIAVFRRWLPPWVFGRWIVRQSANQMTRTSIERTVRAVEMTVESRGESPADLSISRITRIGDRDWIAMQLAVHDLGGLAEFLASGPAVANLAGDVLSWVGTPMRGYRLVGETDHELVWRELAADVEVTTINLGTSASVSADGFVIGRIVESDGLRLFDTAPCPVTESLARAVSSSPRHWLDAIKDSEDPEMVGALAAGQDAPLLTDVPEHVWADLTADDILSQLRHPDDDVIDPHLMGAVLLCFESCVEVAGQLGPEHARGLAFLSERLDGPVSNLCADLASVVRKAA
ncbi:hypothetical protein [Nocardioides sp. Root140]|uniref:hypothetical protein n=1 Tax=Nocardioides sp. Root140 TaxID=1736460 RepID=UPI0006FD1201|nr:hypothetical protein [Nocardioides sp. Root140]KQY56690.1 hypothetical protein ASD30_10270 [Nocardioides sp. Root140]